MKNLISICCLLVLFGFEAAAQCNVSIAASNGGVRNCYAPTITLTADPMGGTAPYTYAWMAGVASANGNTATVNAAGTYTVTMTDALNCTSTATIGIMEDFSSPSVNLTASATTLTCAQSSATLTASGGNMYSWSIPMVSTPNVVVSNAGTYTVTATNANNGCRSSASIIITRYSVNVLTTPVSCYGGNDGFALATIIFGGTPPYTFIWDNGSVSQSYDNLSAGVYTVTVTDANNCSASASGRVGSQNDITTAITPASCLTGLGVAVVNSNATNPVFAWSNGATGNTISAAAGSYVVTITDDFCSRTDTVTIPDVSANLVYGMLLPDGSGTSITNTITVTGNPGAVISSTNPLSAVWANMEHSFRGDVSIKLTCPNNTSVVLKTNAGSSTALGHPCDSNSSPNTRGTGYPFVFSSSGATTLNTSTNTVAYTDICIGAIYQALEGGTFLPENPLSGFDGCPLDGAWTLTVSDALAVDNGYLFDWGLQLPNTCNSTNNFGTVLTSSDNSATYTWSNGQTTPTLQNVAAGIYTATITNASGCFATASITITGSQGNGTGCVYPGDANNDGVANNFDLLPIALSNAMTGSARFNATTQWTPQTCTDWTDSIPNTTTNRKHADCDGNGNIGASDILVILQNYGQVHQRAPFNQIVLNNTPTISCVFGTPNVQPAAYPYLLQAAIKVGSVADPATDITGLAFTINYDANMATSASINLSSLSWLGAPNELYHLQHDDGQGHLDVAVSRFDGTTRNGYGAIATASFVIEDNVIGRGTANTNYPFVVNISTIKAINNLNIEKTVNGAQTQIIVENVVLATDVQTLANQIKITPNPTQGVVRINAASARIESATLTNTLGQVVFQQIIPSVSDATLQFPTLANGVYMLYLTTDAGKITKKLIIQ